MLTDRFGDFATAVTGAAAPQAGQAVVDLAAARDKMGVGEDDELHRAIVSRSHAL